MNISSNFSQISPTAAVPTRAIILIVAKSFMLFVLNIAAFVGNLLVCVAVYRNPSLRTVTNNFIVSLALTELLASTTAMPFFVISTLMNRWIAGEIVSQIIFCCMVTTSETSTLTVMMLTINRYFRVVRPALYGKIYSKKNSALMSIAAWIVALPVAVSFLVVRAHEENGRFIPSIDNFTHFSSKLSLIYFATVSGLLFGIPSLVISICYLKIYQTIRYHNNAAAPSSQAGHSPYGVEEARITRLLTAVVVGFYLCLCPRYIIIILKILKMLPTDVTRYNFIVFIGIIPSFISSVINPVVYGVMNPSFRSEFVKVVLCR